MLSDWTDLPATAGAGAGAATGTDSMNIEDSDGASTTRQITPTAKVNTAALARPNNHGGLLRPAAGRTGATAAAARAWDRMRCSICADGAPTDHSARRSASRRSSAVKGSRVLMTTAP